MGNKIKLNSEYDFGTGTYAVVTNKIEMQLNEFGEYKSILKEKLTLDEESKLQNVCLNSSVSPNEDEISSKIYGSIPGINFDSKIGYYNSLYAGHVLEGNYRKNASSGGFGTWIFKELFERDLIDGVIHVKENKNKNESILFKYDISYSVEEIQEGAKTKYYPVEFSEVLNKIKMNPGRYAIIGIPSFIMSIRLLARQDPILNERIKYTVGLICGHQKSAKFAESLAWQVGIEPGDLKTIDFRKKIMGIPASNYGVEIVGKVKGEEVKVVRKMNEFIGHDWGQGFFKSNASDFTDDVMNETADITLGDAWLPQYVKDSKGNNILVVRNNTIKQILEEAIVEKKVMLDKIDVNTVIQSQMSHYQHTFNELGYRLYKMDKMKKWRPKKRVLATNNISFFRKRIQDLRMEIFKESHLRYKKAVELEDLNYFVNYMEKLAKKYKRLYVLKSIVDMGPRKTLIKAYKRMRQKE